MKKIVFILAALSISGIVSADNVIRVSVPISHVHLPIIPPEENTSFSFIGGAIPDGVDGSPYDFDFNSRVNVIGDGDIGTLQWSLNEPAPAGLLLMPDGRLTGTPSSGFNGNIQLTASNNELSVSSSFPLFIATDVGDKPSYSNVVSLFRFNGDTAKEGFFSSIMTLFGITGFSQASPHEGQSSAIMTGSNGLRNDNSYALGTADFSIGGWFNTSTTSQAQVISQNRDSQNTGQYQLLLSNGRVVYIEHPSGLGLAGIAANGVSANKWHHVALVRSGFKVSIYLDGLLKDEKTPTTKNNLRADNGLSIGYDQRDNRDYFRGNLKDVFQLNKALTAREVMWLYKSGEGFPTP